MSLNVAERLFETGRAHALSSDLLYRSAIKEGKATGEEDPVHFAFNGPYSLSIYYLLSLDLELMLKAAYVAWSGEYKEPYLRKELGHDLVKSLDAAERAGFRTELPEFRNLIATLNDPYRNFWLRYERPEKFPLPSNFPQIIEMLAAIDDLILAKLNPPTEGDAG